MQFRSILFLTAFLIGSAKLHVVPGQAQEHAAEQAFRKAMGLPLGPEHHHHLLLSVKMLQDNTTTTGNVQTTTTTTTGNGQTTDANNEEEEMQGVNATMICEFVEQYFNMTGPTCNNACLGMFGCLQSIVEAVDERTNSRFAVACSRCDKLAEDMETLNGPQCFDGELDDMPEGLGCAGELLCLQDDKQDFCVLKNFTTERQEICEDGCAYQMVNLITDDRCEDAFRGDDENENGDNQDDDCFLNDITVKDICRYDDRTGEPCSEDSFDQTIEVGDACKNEPFLRGFYNRSEGSQEDDCEIESSECRRLGNAYLESGGCCARVFAKAAKCQDNVDLMECEDDFPALDVDNCPVYDIGRGDDDDSAGIASSPNLLIAALIVMLRFY